jgi:hypothetical protein
MILLVIAALACLGGTTGLVLNQSIARDPARHRRLTVMGFALCAVITAIAVSAAAVTTP